MIMFTQPTIDFTTMESQHKITISSVVFYVEDCCKKLLTDHLKIVHRNSSSMNTKDTDDKLAEVLLDELKSEGKQVVTNRVVELLIKRTRNLRKPD